MKKHLSWDNLGKPLLIKVTEVYLKLSSPYKSLTISFAPTSLAECGLKTKPKNNIHLCILNTFEAIPRSIWAFALGWRPAVFRVSHSAENPACKARAMLFFFL